MTGFLIPTVSNEQQQVLPAADTAAQALPKVAVLVPMFRESPATCRRAADGLRQLDYPRDRLTVLWIVPAGDELSEGPAGAAFQSIAGMFSEDSRVLAVSSMEPKGRGLNEALKSVGDHAAVLFLDADVVPAPSQVTEAVELIRAGADIVEAFEFHEAEGLVGRVVGAENATHLGSMMLLQRYLKTSFLQGSSLYVTSEFLARTDGFIEDEAEECFVWSLFASRAEPRVSFLDSPSYGAPVGSLRAALRQRVRWLRGQLAAAKYLRSPELPVVNRVALGITVASIAAQLATAPLAVAAVRHAGARRLLAGVVGLEALRIASTAASPQWRRHRLRDGWVCLLGFELVQAATGWQAVWELATNRKQWHKVRD